MNYWTYFHSINQGSPGTLNMRFFSASGIAKMILLFVLSAGNALGQTAPNPSISASVSCHFDRLYRADPRLLSGNFYRDPTPPSTTGHPFTGEKEWQSGSVIISNIRFDSLKLRYDICNNELVCNTGDLTGTPLQIALNKLHVSSFNLATRHYIHFPSADPVQAARFCEVLAEGGITLLNLESKKLHVPAGGMTSYSYESSSVMFLQINGKLIKYSGRQTLYRLHPELKSQLQAFIRTEKIRLSKAKPEGHARLVSYCNQLTGAAR